MRFLPLCSYRSIGRFDGLPPLVFPRGIYLLPLRVTAFGGTLNSKLRKCQKPVTSIVLGGAWKAKVRWPINPSLIGDRGGGRIGRLAGRRGGNGGAPQRNRSSLDSGAPEKTAWPYFSFKFT